MNLGKHAGFVGICGVILVLRLLQNTGVYGEMARYKITMCEPRGSDRHKVDFDELLKYFYTVIKDTEHAGLCQDDWVVWCCEAMLGVLHIKRSLGEQTMTDYE